MKRIRVIAMIVFCVMMILPLFGFASFQEKGLAIGYFLANIGSTIDSSLTTLTSLPPRATHALANLIDRASASVLTAAEDIATNVKAQMANAKSMTETQMSKIIQRQHSMLKRSVATGKHRMLGAKEAAGKEITNLKSHLTYNIQFSISHFQSMFNDTISKGEESLAQIKNTASNALNGVFASLDKAKNGLRLVRDPSIAKLLSLSNPLLGSAGPAENRTPETSVPTQGSRHAGPSTNVSYQENNNETNFSPLKIIERILVKEVNQESRIMNQGTNDNSNTSMIHDSSFMIQDPRINSLITNVADLTSRLDEKDGSPYRNSALFNMISQSQRIKTLDDVKITNATIEGYATSKGVSDSLATYLPLGGGTLTGGLTGTTLTLSGLSTLTGANLSGVLNASSTAHITGRFSLGENLTFSASSATTTIPSSLRNAFAFATTSSPTPFLTFDTSNYRIGLGSTSPAQTFSLKGSQYLTGGLGVGNATTTSGVLETSGLSYFGGLLKGASNFTFAGSGTSTIAGRLEITASSTVAGYRICTQQNNVCPSPWSSSGGLTTLSTASDLVGLGTSTPSEKLSVNGGVYFDSDIIRYGSSSAPTLNFRYFASSTSTLPNLTSAFTYATSTTNTPLLTLSTKSSRYGRVGIGTSTPSALFAINALNASNQADNLFYIGSSSQNTFVIDNHGNLGIGTSSPRSRLTIDGGLGAYFTSSGLFGLGTTTPWKSSTLSIEQNGVNPLLTLGDTGTTTPFLMVTAKGIISFGSTSPILLNPSDLVIGRNGVTNDAYISGGLGIGNATTTDGILETSGLAFIGGVLKVKGTSSSTFAGPIELTATSTLMGSKLCTAKNKLCTVTIRKTADETVNNSTTLQDDDELFLPMAANETWFFSVNIGHVGNSTADFKFTFTVPAGASIRWGCTGAQRGVDGTLNQCVSITVSGNDDSVTGDTTARHLLLSGVVINSTTAGNLQLQWAQNTATVIDTKVLTNSYLEAHK